MISHFLMYQFELLVLLATRRIDCVTWWYAAKHRPVVVCGPKGGIVVDAAFDMTPAQLARRSTIQFIAGSLLLAAGIGMLTLWVSADSISTGKYVITMMGLMGVGLVLAVDASVAAGRRWYVEPQTQMGGDDVAHRS